MAYNGGFPMGYQQYYPQYQQQMSNIQAQQMMTPPTIHAEIVQVSGRDEAVNFSVNVGQPQMMMAKDDSAIYVKSAYANGQSSFVEYIRKEPEPQSASPEYITREEFEDRISKLFKDKEVVKNELVQQSRESE